MKVAMNAFQEPAATDAELERMIQALEGSGRYRVLRQLTPRPNVAPTEGALVRKGLFVDVETTGLEPDRHEIIELAMVPFTYGVEGQIYAVGEPFNQLREPSGPIPSEITTITGIDDDMVAGKTIDPAAVDAFVASADLVIAHNASFDRRFLERFSQGFNAKPWACSMTQIDWVAEGFEGAKLSYLAFGAGFFYDRHRAVHDCLAAIELLETRLPRSGDLALTQLLARARAPTWRVWAERSPFDLKDVLKARGYRWNADGGAAPKAWYIDVAQNELDAEVAFLSNEIYLGEVQPLTRRIDATDRFSDRC
jgi:DNA polymerase-3 subunit epsilon